MREKTRSLFRRALERENEKREKEKNCERHNFAVHSPEVSLVLVSFSAAATNSLFDCVWAFAVVLCRVFFVLFFESEWCVFLWMRVENLAEGKQSREMGVMKRKQ